MKKIMSVLCMILLSVFIANTVFAQNNASSYFMIDTDLGTAGYQGQSEVLDIGARAKAGFALYAKQFENAAGLTVLFEWDGTKAEYRSGDSATDIVDDDMEINGVEYEPLADEANILGSGLLTAGEISTESSYTISFAQSGGDPSTAAEGLIFFAVFRTGTDFQTTDTVTIKASVTVADGDGIERFLGTRFFHVNAPVDVKPATWKEVKDQFKDF